MRNMIAENRLDIGNNQKNKTFLNLRRAADGIIEKNPVREILVNEGCENLSGYLEELGLNNDPNIVILSSLHHYYYDAEEMKNVNTVINLKELNRINDIKDFLDLIFCILPEGSNFIGCFVDNIKVNGHELRNNSSAHQTSVSFDALENGIVSRIPFINRLYGIMDSKINRTMSVRSVVSQLNDYDFKVLDMKEISGLTYFHSRKVVSVDK